jgi:hypothetical protein
MAALWYVLLAGSVGLLAGFQGVYERFRTESLRAAGSGMGLLYLLSRGAVAAAAFSLVSFYTPLLADHAAWRALACGVGAETILRSKVYVTRIRRSGDNFEDWVKGPLDLLRFYQDFFLTSVENGFTKRRIAHVDSVVKDGTTFLSMCVAFDLKILGWPQTRPDVVEATRAAQLLRTRFGKDAQSAGGIVEATLDRKYRHELCYIVLNNLGEGALDTVFEK